MRRLFVVAALIAIAAPSSAKTKRRGRVVRVERSRTHGMGALRMCSSPTADGGAVCYGQPPRVGELGTVVDDKGVQGVVEIESVLPQKDTCGNDTSWNITSTLLTGSLSQVNSLGAVMLDYKMNAGAHVLTTNPTPIPLGHPSNQMMIEVDNDGDDVPEVIETWYYCDAAGNDVGTWTSGQHGYYCLVYYTRDASDYRELRVDNVENCYN